MKVFIRLFVSGYIVSNHFTRSIALLVCCSIMIASIGMLMRTNMSPTSQDAQEVTSIEILLLVIINVISMVWNESLLEVFGEKLLRERRDQELLDYARDSVAEDQG